MNFCLYIIKNILSPMFYKILTISISASIIGIILLITKKIFKRKISFKINYIIWIIFLFSLLVFPSIENKFSIYNFINLDKIEELSINIKFNSLDTYEDLDLKEDNEFKDFKMKIKNQIDILETKEIISLIYFIVIFYKLIKIIKILITHSKAEKQILDKNSKEYIIIQKIKNKLNIKKDIILIKTNEVKSPLIGGVITPKIFISEENINEIDLECMLTHELCHYKRKDNIINIFLKFFKFVYFFNPIIIWCLNRIEKDIELATDEKTLTILNENMKNRYCKLLVIMTDKQNNNYNLGFSKYKSFLHERVNSILDREKFVQKTNYIIILILIIICILFFCFTKEISSINDKQLEYLQMSINNNKYNIENYNINNECQIIKCKKEESIIILGNKDLYSLTLNKTYLDFGIQNNSTFFFKNNDIEINVGEILGEFSYEFKIKYKNQKEIKYCFIIQIE